VRNGGDKNRFNWRKFSFKNRSSPSSVKITSIRHSKEVNTCILFCPHFFAWRSILWYFFRPHFLYRNVLFNRLAPHKRRRLLLPPGVGTCTRGKKHIQLFSTKKLASPLTTDCWSGTEAGFQTTRKKPKKLGCSKGKENLFVATKQLRLYWFRTEVWKLVEAMARWAGAITFIRCWQNQIQNDTED
jgi:hypothetical protein